MKKLASVALFALAVASNPTISSAKEEKPIELTAAELAAIQSKAYTAPVSVAFPATVSTLQTLGYLNITASKDAGTISGETEAKGKIIYNILWGVGKKKRTQLASLLVEQTTSTQTVVKLNLTVNESKSRGLMGTAFKDGEIVKTAEPYQQFYAALDTEISRRLALIASTAPEVSATAN